MGCPIGILLFSNLLLLLLPCASVPLCTDSRAPATPLTPLVFCPYNGSVCCDSVEDMRLQKLYQSMNIADPACASHLKSILCAKCNKYSAELYEIKVRTRTVPVLCTVSEASLMSKGVVNDFCGEVWNTCQNTSFLSTLFTPSSQGTTKVHVNSTSKLVDLWHSKDAFCKAYGGSSDSGQVCFDGNSLSLHNTGVLQPPKGLCLEKIFSGSYIDMVAHPDGSNRVFIGNLQGKIWLATVPEEGSGETLMLDESNIFLDISNVVHLGTKLGMISIAPHPNFSHNGRFFVSFFCDKLQWPGCSARCSCNTDADCDPSRLGFRDGVMPCQYSSVISEFTANDTTLQSSVGARANPSEVRRIFTMGILYSNPHGGQILFGPDGYLYFTMGDGDDGIEDYNFAENKKSLLGKVLRFDIDSLPSATEISAHDLWGNYSIPKDNPYYDDKELLPEIWALGFRKPWRCNYDSERPSYFLCVDSGQDHYEEVDILTKGGNYGWRFYEGTNSGHLLQSPGSNNSLNFARFMFPVMGYDHSTENTMKGSAAIAGGYFYRSKTDPCMYGRYLYADLYGFAIWAGTENPENSGNYTTAKLPFSCAHDSPIQCSSGRGSSLSILGYVFSVVADNRKDVFFLTSNGVLRVSRPSRCNYACSKENGKVVKKPKLVGFTSIGSKSSLGDLKCKILLLFALFLLFQPLNL